MFSLFDGLYDSYLAPPQLNLLVVGAPSVGKTTFLERLKVTQIPKRPKTTLHTPEALTPVLLDAFLEGGASNSKNIESDEVSPVKPKIFKAPLVPVVTQKRRFPLICPAPERYMKTAQDQDEDFVVEEEEEKLLKADGTTNLGPMESTIPLDGLPSPTAPMRVRCHSKEFQMEHLDLIQEGGAGSENRNNSMEDIPIDDAQLPPTPTMWGKDDAFPNPPLVQSTSEEYDMKPNAKMLPMSKIRPTIGTNLGKLDMYGAKCHFFDVGGRLQDLWERYYDDCDAVVFCWKLGKDPDKPPDVDGDDDDEDPFDMSKQQEILNQVRKSIPDDIPFLVFGHVFGNVNVELVDKVYETNLILPHYHNPMTGLCCGSAKTGAGLQSAMEWLIPLAKRLQKERLAARKQLTEKL